MRKGRGKGEERERKGRGKGEERERKERKERREDERRERGRVVNFTRAFFVTSLLHCYIVC